MARTSCGVIVTDGARLLLGHATRSPRWDIPKGIAETGEAHLAAALRELAEETGLAAPPGALRSLGVHGYMPGKALALFAWHPVPMPDPAGLACRASIRLPGGALIPEFDRFGLFAWPEALSRVGRNMARVLASVRDAAGPAS
ncbi:MAG: NUDIX hydrolase [Acetobacteraceae bacterium]|nr:NUDIX hydrolase [Acetobacteraceae bacterium]